MPVGAFTDYIDVAQIVLYVFWLFFFGLIFYLRNEDRREGYPLEPDLPVRGRRPSADEMAPMPKPKSFLLPHGAGEVQAPSGRRDTREIRAVATAPWPGAPLEPTGDPMIDGVGPASYAERADVPDLTPHGDAKIVPLRRLAEFAISARDPDPRGMPVIGCDGQVGGTVRDVWIDQSEIMIRYLEVETAQQPSRLVLLPMTFATVDAGAGAVQVPAITAAQFANVPGTRHPEQVTLLEEDRIVGYFGGGLLYAKPERLEPIL